MDGYVEPYSVEDILEKRKQSARVITLFTIRKMELSSHPRGACHVFSSFAKSIMRLYS